MDSDEPQRAGAAGRVTGQADGSSVLGVLPDHCDTALGQLTDGAMDDALARTGPAGGVRVTAFQSSI